MNSRRPEAEPKPFALVPIPSQKPGEAEATMHDQFRGLTGRLDLIITVESEYFFVGSGSYEFDPNARGDRPDVWYTFYRRNGQLCIPGTSIKGAIRAIVEAISNSCVSQYRRQEQSAVDSGHRPCRFQNESSPLCPACRLFGTTGYRGRVHFSDAVPQGSAQTRIVKIAELWEPKRATKARRFYEVKRFQAVGNQRPEKNFRFVEAVQKNSQFRVTLHFENLTEAELGLMCYALGWGIDGEDLVTDFLPKLGGAKPRCFGAVGFDPNELCILFPSDLLRGLPGASFQDTDLNRKVVDYMRKCASSNLLYNQSMQELMEKLQEKDDNCPKEAY